MFLSLNITKEILTGRTPFAQYKIDGAVIMAVTLRDERPQRLIEDKISEPVQTILQRCWLKDPNARLATAAVAAELSKLPSNLERT